MLTRNHWWSGCLWLVLLLLAVPVVTNAQEKSTRTLLVDDFPMYRYSTCSDGARLDNFANQLQGNMPAVGYIVAYGPPVGGRNSSHYALTWIMGYLTQHRGIAETNLKPIKGKFDPPAQQPGDNTETEKYPRIQLLVVPEGAPPPEIEEEKEPKVFRGHFSTELFYWSLNSVPVGTDDSEVDFISAQRYVEALKAQATDKGHLVIRAGKDARPHQIDNALNDAAKPLYRLGLTESRITTVFGGYYPAKDEESEDEAARVKVEYWILAADAPPVKAASIAPVAQDKPLLIGEYEGDYSEKEWGESYLTNMAFNLRHESDAKLYLIARVAPPSQEVAPPSQEEATNETEEGYAPSLSLPEVMEKWRKTLQKEHKIAPERIIIWILPAEDESNSVAAWLVPRGAPLPNVHSIDEEEEELPTP